MIRLSTAAALLLFLCPSVSATDYYLDGSAGSDGNPGTAALPWRTITYALNQPLAAGDQLRLRGTFSTSETFPLSLLPGVSITTWDASTTARIDAGASPCIRIIRPGSHTEEIVGNAGSLVIVGSPAVRIEAPNAAMRCTTRIAGCRIEGRFEVYVAYGHPGYAGDYFHPVVEDCEVIGDMHLFSDSEGNGLYDDLMAATVRRNVLRGSFLAENPEMRSATPSLLLQDNEVYGQLRCLETAYGDALLVRIVRNRVVGGRLEVDSSSGNGFMRAEVFDNTVTSGGISTVLVSADSRMEVSGNTCHGDITAWADFFGSVDRNAATGTITVTGRSFPGPGSVSDNTCITLDVTGYGQYELNVQRNRVTGGGLLIRNAMIGASIQSNVISTAQGDGICVLQTGWLGTLFLNIHDNTIISSSGGPGRGICIDGQHRQVSIARNTINRFASGMGIAANAQIGTQSIGTGLTVDSNIVRACQTGLAFPLGQVIGQVQITRNCVSTGSTGVQLARGSFTGLLTAWGNILSNNSIADVAPGSLLPTDDIRGNLAEDGSLLDFHPSNISGDPHFVDAANGDFHLRPTSPCIAPGNNPAGGDIGRYQSGLQPTLEVVELGANLVSIRTHGESGDHAILLIGAYPARPAALSLCDGLLGLDVPTILTVLPGLITFGQWDLLVTVPPNLNFTAVLQSLRVDLSAPTECGLTNTRFFRR